MVAMLVCPTEETSWRIDVGAFGTWLTSRWPTIGLKVETGQRAHLWTWPDHQEVWVPEVRNCVWLEADDERVAAVATWVARSTTQPLTLCDMVYNDDEALTAPTEESLRWRLAHWGR